MHKKGRPFGVATIQTKRNLSYEFDGSEHFELGKNGSDKVLYTWEF